MVEYDEKAAREIERNYIALEVAQQRIRTIEGLALRSGEHVLDAGLRHGFARPRACNGCGARRLRGWHRQQPGHA